MCYCFWMLSGSHDYFDLNLHLKFLTFADNKSNIDTGFIFFSPENIYENAVLE